MIKSILFLSLYTVAGVGSYGAYSFISKQDSSLNSLSAIVSQATHFNPEIEKIINPETSNIVYRWKDHKGNWNYEDAPYSELTFKNYEDELKFLQKLKETREQIRQNPSKNENAIIASTSESASPIDKLKKLFEDAKNVQNLVDIRKDTIDEIARQSQH